MLELNGFMEVIMNVSKGDLAIIAGAPIHNGLIVEVLDYFGNDNGYTCCWNIKFKPTKDYLSNKLITTCTCPDEFLRRICPPQDQLIPDPVEISTDEPVCV
jgi:hypothetical protein